MSDVTATSGGQTFVPPFRLFYYSNTDRLVFEMQIANISNNTVHATVRYHNQTGEIVKTVETDIAAGCVYDTQFDTSSTPGTTMLPFYATIQWTGPYSVQKPLTAHACVRYLIYPAQDTNYLPINGGMPF